MLGKTKTKTIEINTYEVVLKCATYVDQGTREKERRNDRKNIF